MELLSGAAGFPAHVGILPGSFNPPTRAHLAMAEAGLKYVDEVLLVLPKVFPHKEYEAADFLARARMLQAALGGLSHLSAAASEGGLFVEIARECKEVYGPGTRLSFLCGRDAAERVVNWDYGTPGAIEQMLEDFELLVASRHGEYRPPHGLRRRIHRIRLPGDFEAISATVVRERIRRGMPWEELVPPSIISLIREIYRPPA